MSRLIVAWVTAWPRSWRISTSSAWLPTGRLATISRIARRRSAAPASRVSLRPFTRPPLPWPSARRSAACRRSGRPGRGPGRGARAPSAMIASAPSQPRAACAARTLGTMPPAITPLAISASASAIVSESRRRPSASRTPSTSVSMTSWRAPRPAAMPAATSSALTLQTIAALVAGERRDDRDLAADQDRVEQVAPEPDDMGHEAEPRHPLGDEQAAVDARQADRIDARGRAARRRARC